jgi:hypothetical protein
VLLVGALTATSGAQAATITWTQWTSGTSGNPGSATGTLALSPDIAVSFSGKTGGIVSNYPSWGPAATFADGTVVANAPPKAGGIVYLTGGDSTVQTLSFSAPVVNPIMSIWSLGNSSQPASFNFIDATPVFVSGGRSNEYGGSAISVSGNVVSGREGNGTVEFIGTFNSLKWTNPSAEGWYGFTVGVTAAAVPEPESLPLLMLGLGAVALGLRRARRA